MAPEENSLDILLRSGKSLDEIDMDMKAGVTVADQADAMKTDVHVEKPAVFDRNGRFLHHVLGDYLLRTAHIGTIDGVLSIYDDGIYRSGDAAFHREIIKLYPHLNDAKRREVLRYLRFSPKTPELEVAPPNLIPFKSRVYDIEADTFTDYRPELVFTCRFPVDYDPAAPSAPLIEQLLHSISRNDGDVLRLICEAAGYCLYRQNIHRIALLLLGNGSNGKSTLLNLIEQFIGQGNCSNLSLQDLEQRFRVAELYGKAANLCDDCGSGFIQDSSILKRVITGGELVAERKGQDPFTFRPFAKNIMALNELPTIADRSNGLYSRLVILPLRADFSQSPDLGLKDRKWTQPELNYFCRVAVNGLKHLLDRGDFTRPQCVDEALTEYKRGNNPVLQFLDQAGDTIHNQPTAEIYQDYKGWALDGGYKPLSVYQFSREVCRHGYTTEPLYMRTQGKSVRCFVKSA